VTIGGGAAVAPPLGGVRPHDPPATSAITTIQSAGRL
jgi:hypothetical protein